MKESHRVAEKSSVFSLCGLRSSLMLPIFHLIVWMRSVDVKTFRFMQKVKGKGRNKKKKRLKKEEINIWENHPNKRPTIE